ncbi:MSMEG_0569 family flavin-dependent oxidoreductase [Cellvibrio fibrivorans]|uniref:Flavoprotein involved in K+ transport n=1 Tax=Cellvibrio fibrivorans TaxID=126350 RepID=A0ABU1UZ23_9GAMM|nr:MSMEG_0569 family flavin-dependent oxidoreductase [Cellvibrio fibrivorans]MDR7090425.1 putative flavoprotein involved in K+ transport [Cellvibrio fibrivorans]
MNMAANIHSSPLRKHHSAIVIGAGQAGLSMSYCLSQQGIDNIILEKSSQVADNWRNQRWDTFCLVTPNWQCQLPGFPYRGNDPDGFMVKDEIVDYLESYRAFFNPQIIFNSPVISLSKNGELFTLVTADTIYTANQVVIACGSYHEPRIPTLAKKMPAHIAHVHSNFYKNPAQLPPGEVMVVGTGQSGCQIAEDLHLAGRKVHLCVGPAPRVNRRYRGRDVVNWLDDMGYYTTTLETHPDGKNAVHSTNHYVTGRDGGRDLNLRIFAEQGMKLYGVLKDTDGERLFFKDDLKQNLDYADQVAARIVKSIEEYIQKNGIAAPEDDNVHSDYLPDIVTELELASSGINSVVWSTGFAMRFDWINLPVFDESGHPKQKRGVTDTAGLYFIGLNWMHTWGSGRFYQVGRDAEYLSEVMVAQHKDMKVSA